MNSFYSEEELKEIGFRSYGKNVYISRKCSILLVVFKPVTSGTEVTRVPAFEIYPIGKIKAVFNLIIVTMYS